MDNNYLDKIADQYNPEMDFDYHLISYGYRRIRHFLIGKQVLEMGCATGVMTKMLLKDVSELEVVDGSKKYTDALSGLPEFGDVVFHHSLFETFSPTHQYSDIIMAHAVEHLEDPVDVLRTAKEWLTQDGRIHIIVPNAGSLHRRLGVAMGFLNTTSDLSDRDRMLGHHRVYTKDLLELHIKQAGFRIVHYEGVFLKPLSNSQMESWDIALYDALDKVGNVVPELCSEIYVVAEAVNTCSD